MKVIGIKFKDGGKIYYFAPNEGEEYEAGTQVVVETSKGLEFATVAFPPKEVDDSEVVQPLKPIVRIATEKDKEQVRRNLERKPQAMKLAQEKIEKHNLAMKLIDCEFAFDGSKVIFYFSAESRVDFRDLVKDLAGAFHIRIELRQVGIRDETRLLGGIAPCGRECCCAGAMCDFKKVSIKMAKVQGLSLNPGKISGLCGRLMCCLSYENDYYSEVYKKMPKVGAEVSTPDGKGSVASVNMLKLTVRVKQEKDGSLTYKDYPLDDIRFRGKKGEAEEEPEEFEEAEAELFEAVPAEEGEHGEPREKERRERPNDRNKKRDKSERRGERGERNDRNRDGESGGSRPERSEKNPPKGEQGNEPRERRERDRRGRDRRNRREGKPAGEHKPGEKRPQEQRKGERRENASKQEKQGGEPNGAQ